MHDGDVSAPEGEGEEALRVHGHHTAVLLGLGRGVRDTTAVLLVTRSRRACGVHTVPMQCMQCSCSAHAVYAVPMQCMQCPRAVHMQCARACLGQEAAVFTNRLGRQVMPPVSGSGRARSRCVAEEAFAWRPEARRSDGLPAQS